MRENKVILASVGRKDTEESLEILVCQGKMERRVYLGSQVKKEIKAFPENLATWDQLDKKELLGKWASQVRLARRAPRATWVLPVIQASKARMDLKENKVFLVNLGLESLDIQEKRVRQASRDSLAAVERKVRRVTWGCQVNRVIRDQRERKAPLDFLVRLEYQEKRGLQGFLDLKEKLDLMVVLVMLACRDLLDHLGRKGILVLTASPAPQGREESQVYLDKASLGNLVLSAVKVIKEVLAFLVLLAIQVSLG